MKIPYNFTDHGSYIFSPTPTTGQSMPLSDKHETFCHQYLIDFNGSQAAIRTGYSRRTARAIASTLLKRPDIEVRLTELKRAALDRFEADADEIVQMWWDTATADPNELIQHRIGACRYCHGADHQYQWRSERELVDAQNEFDLKYVNAKKNVKDLVKKIRPKNRGGFGYNISVPPSQQCPECSGMGESRIVVMDTTKLSPQARLLYNGVKVTRQGREVLMADRQAALGFVARRLGLLKEQDEGKSSSGFAELLEFINKQGSSAPIVSATKAQPILNPIDD